MVLFEGNALSYNQRHAVIYFARLFCLVLSGSPIVSDFSIQLLVF